MSASGKPTEQDLIAEALPAFISEAKEQVENLELLLLQLEDAPGDRELLNALFRCAHTVKGSAGLFGLDEVVAFTHHIETLLDRMREGHVLLTPALSTLLLQCNDQVRLLVAAAGDPQVDTQHAVGTRAVLVDQLQQASGDAGATAAHGAAEQGVAVAEAVGSGATEGCWRLSVRFGRECLRNGFDPLPVLSYLGQLGTLEGVACEVDAVPSLEDIDPEDCHLGFNLGLRTGASREQIEDAFSFVRDDVELVLVAPSPAVAMPVPSLPAPPVGLAAGLAEPVASPKPGKAREGAAAGGDDNRYIRVQADRLDAVINLLGELVIAGAGASLLARQSRNSPLMEANQQISRLIEEIRNGTLQLRMVPIGETFSRFRRVVRDTASELGKEVQLEIVGADTELDKSVVERIADPLMHLVRNGLDHGLETPQERLAQGKPAQGRLTLSASHEAGSILIQIEDDGRGIDRDKVLARAWERGLVEQGVVPPDAEITQLIFEPGFSTAQQITNLSGRGVGMDVVRRNIEALRGTVTLHSPPGMGTRMDIRLPLTLAIIDGFLVAVAASRFVLPLEAVVEVIEVDALGLDRDERGRSTVELRGQMLPVVCLRTLYGLDGEAPERQSIVVIKSGGRRYGVIVDLLMGQHQTVIKPLGRMFRSLRGMAGSSILGNGEVALIFDVHGLGDLASSESDVRSNRGAGRAPPGSGQSASARQSRASAVTSLS